MLGRYVARQLHAGGFDLRILARNPDKARGLLSGDVEVVRADLRDPSSLRAALRGMEGVYASLSTDPHERNAEFRTEVEGVRHLIEAARECGVRRIGYLSALVTRYEGIDWWVFDCKREACRMLRESEVTATIFYPSNFFENITELQMSGRRIMLGGTQRTQSWWIGAEDFGQQVAASFRLEEDRNREYTVQGPESFNFEEAAEEFIRNCRGERLKTMKAPLWPFRLLSPFSSTLDYQYRILYAINHFDEQFESGDTWEELGKPRTTLAEFAEAYCGRPNN